MEHSNEKSYTEFFKEELYGGFVKYLLNKYTARHVNDRLKDEQLISKRGVHYSFTMDFNKFLMQNPNIAKRFSNESNNRFMGLRNIAGGKLYFPIDTDDDVLMVEEGIRSSSPYVSTSIEKDRFPRARHEHKVGVVPFEGTVHKSSDNDRPYLCPKRLTVHFKEGYARHIGKTTESFMVNSRSEAMIIILDRFEKNIAFATIQGKEEFAFVRSRNGKEKKNRKLRG